MAYVKDSERAGAPGDTVDDGRAGVADDVTTKAGRGTIYLTASKLWFMVTGAAITFVLPRVLTIEEVGEYKVVIGLVSVVNAVVVTGTIQTVSKFVAQMPDRAPAIMRKALVLQCFLGGSVAAAFALAAPFVAKYGLKDESLTPYLRLASLITASYTFYSVFMGVLNGRKEFLRQAGLDSFYSTAKMVLIVGLALAGLGLMGAISGFVAAAFVVLVVAIFVVGRRSGGGESPVGFRGLLGFQTALIVFLLVYNLLMKTDLLLIKALISTDPDAASKAAGVYGAALDFAYTIFQVILSLTLVVFPLVSEATFKADAETVRGYIRQALRATLAISALPAVLFSANAAHVLGIIYPQEYVAGAPVLRIVAFGMLAFAVMTILTTVISSSGRPMVSVCAVAGTLALDAGLNAAFIPRWGMAGAALATTIAMTAGAVGCSVYVRARFGASARLATLLRVAIAAGVVYALSLVAPVGEIVAGQGFAPLVAKAAVVVQFAVLGVVYIALLFALREIGGDEVRMARKIAGV
jgi:O-antigen/teichoic acid export membrane protein